MIDPDRFPWRSLDEFADPQLAGRRGEGEFEDTPLRHVEAAGRRDFLRAAGFVLAGSAITGCSRAPVRTATPLPTQPEGYFPGRSYQYATVCGGCTAGCGVLAKVRDGRPVKLEGNPEHPLSRGGLCAVGQASILSLYDSHRLRKPLSSGKPLTWEETDRAISDALSSIRRQKGAVRVLTATITSPTLLQQIRAFAATFDNARHVVFDPLSVSTILDAHGETFGLRVLPRTRFERAPVVASFDADFLGTWISPAEFTRGYREGRLENGRPSATAWHAQLESRMSLTGTKADERIRLSPGQIAPALEALTVRLASRAGARFPDRQAADSLPEKQLDALADRLWNSRGHSLVVCGLADVAAQKLCVYANYLLGNYGATLDLERPSLQRQGDDRAMAALLKEIASGQVAALFVHGLNPAADLPLERSPLEAFRKIPLLVSLSCRLDETAELARFVCPDADPLESWGDAEPVAGVVCLQQPAILQMGESRAAMQSIAAWSGRPTASYDLVRSHWRDAIHPRHESKLPFEEFWRTALQAGAIQVKPGNRTASAFRLEAVQPLPAPAKQRGLTAVLYAKAAIPDGRQAYNPWLQELPDPVTKATWDNYASLSLAKAASLGVSDGDIVRLTAGGQALELPALVQPGQHDDAIAVALGYGRKVSQRFSNVGPKWLYARPSVGANGLVGANAASLLDFREDTIRYTRSGVQVENTGRKHDLALTQTHHTLTVPPKLDPGGPPRPIIQETSMAALSAGAAHEEEAHPELWPRDHQYKGHRWAMAIDLDACSGCSACVVSCQIENNVPVAGRDEVFRNREMHWLRIDRYYSGSPEDPRVAHQPMMCQHCEHAPCETVCPVLATVHSGEGLNQQVYNRCVGTRYCANNCPYKVRRFNWFDYPREDRLVNLVLNPDVTVRSRGVMEKCSFCVQRIQEAKIEAKRLGKPLADGDVAPACQQSCPAQAIAFGNMNDPRSQVSQWAAQPRRYRVLEEINVRPSVYYLKVIRRGAETKQGDQHG